LSKSADGFAASTGACAAGAVADFAGAGGVVGGGADVVAGGTGAAVSAIDCALAALPGWSMNPSSTTATSAPTITKVRKDEFFIEALPEIYRS
jgi:hypothetical protein